MLRAVLHLMIEELKRQRIERPFETVLAMAFFVLNALTSVGGKTQYQPLYGRQPGMLPPIEGTSRLDTADGRAEQRIREIAVQSMT